MQISCNNCHQDGTPRSGRIRPDAEDPTSVPLGECYQRVIACLTEDGLCRDLALHFVRENPQPEMPLETDYDLCLSCSVVLEQIGGNLNPNPRLTFGISEAGIEISENSAKPSSGTELVQYTGLKKMNGGTQEKSHGM